MRSTCSGSVRRPASYATLTPVRRWEVKIFGLTRPPTVKIFCQEMDQMCNKWLGPEVRAKYKKNYRPPVTKPKPPQKFFNSDIVTASPKPLKGKPNIVTAKPKLVTAKPKIVTTKSKFIAAKSTVTAKPLPFTSLPVKKTEFREKDKNKNEKKNKSTRGKNKRKNKDKNRLKETERSSSAGRAGFVVVSDPERRLRLRSYWMRAG